MIKKNIKLPDKPSALLKLAVKDAQKIEKLKKYNTKYDLDMGTWYTKNYNREGTCSVCMAGAVMVCEGAISLSEEEIDFGPNDFSDKIYKKFMAINIMRTGKFPDPHLYLPNITATDIVINKFEDLISVRIDEDLGRADWDVYLEAADYLEENGL